MINVITNFGTSFKGLAAYLLSDIDREGDERVAWTETHGLATEDPQQAYKIMIATAKSQADLKDQAGIAKTGNKSHKHVMHYVLSWHPDEHGEIDRDEMLAAAKASMSYLGVYEGEKLGKNKKTGKPIIAKRTQHADEHQALIVCHDEGPGKAPHIHIMLNRVHPEHGVMLPDSKDYEKLSAWALDYRTAQGKEHLCPERQNTHAKKAQGIVSSNPRKPRNVYEQEQAIADADPNSRKKALLEQLETRRKDLATKQAALKQKQTEAMHGLEARHLEAERKVKEQTAETIKAKTASIRAEYAPRVEALSQRQADEMASFKEAKGTAAGHVRNTWVAFKTKQWMTEIRTNPLEAMKHSFTLAFNSGLQQRDIEKHHGREQSELRGARTREEEAARLEARMDEGFKLDDLRQQYHEQRNDLILENDMDHAKLKAEWVQLNWDYKAVEAEDQRSPKASPEGGDQSPGSGQQGKENQEGAAVLGVQGEHQQQAAPPLRIPPDRLRQIVEDLKTAREISEQREQNRDLDQGR